MPPVPKYTREDVINTAFSLARKEGMDAVVARSVAAALNTSVSPIFTIFKNMDELKWEVVKKARQAFTDYMKDVFDYIPVFKEYGLRWVQFAREEPHLYRILFQYQNMEIGASIYNMVNESFDGALDMLRDDICGTFGLSKKDAEELYDQMVIHAHGIAICIMQNGGAFTQEKISKSLSLVCKSVVISMKLKDGSWDERWARMLLEYDDMVPKRRWTSGRKDGGAVRQRS